MSVTIHLHFIATYMLSLCTVGVSWLDLPLPDQPLELQLDWWVDRHWEGSWGPGRMVWGKAKEERAGWRMRQNSIRPTSVLNYLEYDQRPCWRAVSNSILMDDAAGPEFHKKSQSCLQRQWQGTQEQPSCHRTQSTDSPARSDPASHLPPTAPASAADCRWSCAGGMAGRRWEGPWDRHRARPAARLSVWARPACSRQQ